MKLWRNDEKGNDRIIAYANGTIYKGNPNAAEANNIVFSFNTTNFSSNSLTEIPMHYLKEIHMEEGKRYIEVFFGNDSTEHLRIKDQARRTEIFEYLKNNIPRSRTFVDKYSKLRAGRKPLIAMIVIFALFAWTFYIAHGIESGTEYDVQGQQYRSVSGIVLALASLGVVKISLIFGALFAIALISFLTKSKHPKIVSKIQIVR